MQWIKGADRVPTDHSRYFIKIEGTMSIGHWSKHHEMFINESNDFFPEDQVEWLDESPPASAEKEAARLYPDEATGMQFMTTTNEIATYQRSAHITCAGMYVDTIDNLKNDVAKLEAENKALIEEIQNWKDELKDQAREYRNNR